MIINYSHWPVAVAETDTALQECAVKGLCGALAEHHRERQRVKGARLGPPVRSYLLHQPC